MGSGMKLVWLRQGVSSWPFYWLFNSSTKAITPSEHDENGNSIVVGGASDSSSAGSKRGRMKRRKDHPKLTTKADEIEGFCGNKPIEDLLEFLGEPATEAKVVAKKVKKKKNASDSAVGSLRETSASVTSTRKKSLTTAVETSPNSKSDTSICDEAIHDQTNNGSTSLSPSNVSGKVEKSQLDFERKTSLGKAAKNSKKFGVAQANDEAEGLLENKPISPSIKGQSKTEIHKGTTVNKPKYTKNFKPEEQKPKTEEKSEASQITITNSVRRVDVSEAEQAFTDEQIEKIVLEELLRKEDDFKVVSKKKKKKVENGFVKAPTPYREVKQTVRPTSSRVRETTNEVYSSYRTSSVQDESDRESIASSTGAVSYASIARPRIGGSSAASSAASSTGDNTTVVHVLADERCCPAVSNGDARVSSVVSNATLNSIVSDTALPKRAVVSVRHCENSKVFDSSSQSQPTVTSASESTKVPDCICKITSNEQLSSNESRCNYVTNNNSSRTDDACSDTASYSSSERSLVSFSRIRNKAVELPYDEPTGVTGLSFFSTPSSDASTPVVKPKPSKQVNVNGLLQISFMAGTEEPENKPAEAYPKTLRLDEIRYQTTPARPTSAQDMKTCQFLSSMFREAMKKVGRTQQRAAKSGVPPPVFKSHEGRI